MKLVFLHSSDTHGFLMPTDYQVSGDYTAPIGLSRVSSVVKSERKKYGADKVVVTDAGDCLQGSPLASYAHSTGDMTDLDTFTQAYNKINYDARCLGNHDFNFGQDYLAYYVDNNKASIINDNIFDAETDVPAFGKEFQIIEKSGVKIGFLGITTQYIPHWESEDHIKGLAFKSAYDQIKKYAKILRPQVDILAVIYHGGFESDPQTGEATEPHRGENEGYKILTEIPEVDVFLTGHQHRRLNDVVNNTAIVQPGYRGEAVAKVEVELDDQTKKIVSMSTSLIDTKDYEPDPEIVDLVSDLDKRTQTWLYQPIATLDEPAPIENAMKGRLEGAPFINLLQQMQLWFTNADVSATAVMSEKAKGFDKKVTLRDVILNYPYANQLCRVKLTGKELKEIIEHSVSFLKEDETGKITFLDRWIKPKPQLYHFDVFYPVKYEADISKPVGERITELTLNGEEIDDSKTYHLAVNNYRAMGGGFYPEYSMDKIEFTLDKDYVQMFTEYLTSGEVKVDQTKNYRFY
ncbi:bifunctional metallophosphatase/5'-nucleotidase [Lactobacillus gigeriorum]|uniref:5-nucleotidase n=1 Tax=Lactobacillus gigeriorum DSM 23908 = CRBIP 24.85 TaxID=1423751 RepID=I7KQ69_9LACO|nr:bifunctional UDP-sugar hydrolase/5'-nucleotidase [Lactobacillus gigeriorum]KRN14634.1 5-nucleotidase [Lactobacillus gigeriorum DSM 23908 = CRBIP 24.85]CCI87769.1 5-nucleotidase [Lactobacillus gigeriorum DSM 23908 = CRBIP 24.85]